ncbi:hypothetical protein ONZ45_g18354 [Pleurotus djamor]|nr:hypothetical protein ONZ45_g18354 [Pleurotus djamor]
MDATERRLKDSAITARKHSISVSETWSTFSGLVSNLDSGDVEVSPYDIPDMAREEQEVTKDVELAYLFNNVSAEHLIWPSLDVAFARAQSPQPSGTFASPAIRDCPAPKIRRLTLSITTFAVMVPLCAALLYLWMIHGIGPARNYASPALGSRIIKELTTSTAPSSVGLMFRRLLGNPVARGYNPEEILNSLIFPGHCWAFRGDAAHIGIGFAQIADVQYIQVRHAPLHEAPDTFSSQAPKDFIVWGLITTPAVPGPDIRPSNEFVTTSTWPLWASDTFFQSLGAFTFENPTNDSSPQLFRVYNPEHQTFSVSRYCPCGTTLVIVDRDGWLVNVAFTGVPASLDDFSMIRIRSLEDNSITILCELIPEKAEQSQVEFLVKGGKQYEIVNDGRNPVAVSGYLIDPVNPRRNKWRVHSARTGSATMVQPTTKKDTHSVDDSFL